MDSMCMTTSSAAEATPAVGSVGTTTSGLRDRTGMRLFQFITLVLWLLAGGFMTWLVADFNRTLEQPVAPVPPWFIFSLFLVSTFFICWLNRRSHARAAASLASQPSESDVQPVCGSFGSVRLNAMPRSQFEGKNRPNAPRNFALD